MKFWDFSEKGKTPVFSSSTFGAFGFLKILLYKVWNLGVILVLLCCFRRYEPSGENRLPFVAPGHRERDDAARVAL